MTTEYDTDGSVLAIAQYYYDEEGNKLRQYTGLTSPLRRKANAQHFWNAFRRPGR